MSYTNRARVLARILGLTLAALLAISIGAWASTSHAATTSKPPAPVVSGSSLTNGAPAPLPADTDPDVCGPWSQQGTATASAIVSTRTIRNCMKVGSDWIITTTDGSSTAGSIGVLACGSNSKCLDGRNNPTATSHWNWFQPAGLSGGATVLGVDGSSLIVDVAGQQLDFNLGNDQFSASAVN